MLNMLSKVYSRVAENTYVAKPGEMLDIAKEFYQLAQGSAPGEASEGKARSRIKFYEDCYLKAVKTVTKQESEDVRGRWDVYLLSSGVQKAEQIERKCQGVSRRLRKTAGSLNERVRWSRRRFHEEIKKRAKSCEKVGKAVLRRVQSEQKRARRAYNFTADLARKSISKTHKKAAELRLKLRAKVDSAVVAPALKLSRACADRVKPLYKSSRARVSRVWKHSTQTARDLKDVLVQSSLEYSAPLRERTVDLVVPIVAEQYASAKQGYSNGKKAVAEKLEPVTETLLRNHSSLKRFFGFSWEFLKEALSENVDLAKEMTVRNKEFLEQYADEVDLEVFYARSKSVSLRETLGHCSELLWSLFAKKEKAPGSLEEEPEAYEREDSENPEPAGDLEDREPEAEAEVEGEEEEFPETRGSPSRRSESPRGSPASSEDAE